MQVHVPRLRWLSTVTALLSLVALGLHVGIPTYRQHRAILALAPRVEVKTVCALPKQLRSWIGVSRPESFCRVTEAWVTTGDFDDSDARNIADLPDLQRLFLWQSSVTDSGLQHLGGLSRLRVLILMNTKISDRGLRYLQALPNLRELDLTMAQVTDEGLANLSEMKQLEELHLDWTLISDDGLADAETGDALPADHRRGCR